MHALLSSFMVEDESASEREMRRNLALLSCTISVSTWTLLFIWPGED